MTVLVGYCHGQHVDGWFHDSLFDLFWADRHHGLLEGRVAVQGSQLVAARNEVARRFLATPAEWLWMVDDDMTFPPNIVTRLVDAAHPKRRPILGGLCFSVSRDGTVAPTLYRLDEQTGVLDRARHLPDSGGLVSVDATGAACLLVHRTVLEHLDDGSPSPWFDELELAGERLGEDMTFCLRARLAGFPIYVHTGIDVGHVKSQAFGAAQWRAQQKQHAAPFRPGPMPAPRPLESSR